MRRRKLQPVVGGYEEVAATRLLLDDAQGVLTKGMTRFLNTRNLPRLECERGPKGPN